MCILIEYSSGLITNARLFKIVVSTSALARRWWPPFEKCESVSPKSTYLRKNISIVSKIQFVYFNRFRFFSTSAAVRNQIIFSNCDTKGGQEPSVEISLDTLFHEVVFNINTYKGPPKRFTIMYQVIFQGPSRKINNNVSGI